MDRSVFLSSTMLLLLSPVGTAADLAVVLDGRGSGRTFDGVGAVSGGGGNSRLLIEYPEPYRSQILDFLFKPNFGASLQALKVEVGGDANSTSGAEPSHMRFRGDLDCRRGYEWWLMEQAKARNPELKLLALEWTAPGWIGGGVDFWSQDNIDYLASWIGCAQAEHHLDIDAVGGWNESYRGWNLDWFARLKQMLAERGLATKIIGFDEYYTNLSAASRAIVSDPASYASIDIAAAHYPCGWGVIRGCAELPQWAGLARPLWNSESNSDALSIARITNLEYIDARMTASIIWPLVGATYAVLPHAEEGLVLAGEPWSGRYSVGLNLWAVAHTTQFAQPGWQYLDGASGRFPSGGTLASSFVTLKAPGGSDYSVIVETAYAGAAQTINLSLAGGLSTGMVHVWSTNLRSTNPADWFVHERDIAPVSGAYSVTLQPGYLYSLTTTEGQRKGGFERLAEYPSRRGATLSLPYADPFDGHEPGRQPLRLADVSGAFETASCAGGRDGGCLRQVVSEQPYFWWYSAEQLKASDPYTLVGDFDWGDYQVRADVLLEAAGAVQLLGRVGYQAWADPSRLNAYTLEVNDWGGWTLVRGDYYGERVVLAAGTARKPLGIGQWHTLALSFSGSGIQVELDGVVLGTAVDPSYSKGLAGLGVTPWIHAQFDNFSVTPIAPRPESRPRR